METTLYLAIYNIVTIKIRLFYLHKKGFITLTPESVLYFTSCSFLNMPGSNPIGPACPINPGNETELSEKNSCFGVTVNGSSLMSMASSYEQEYCGNQCHSRVH